jgi:hypothetical protein
MDKHRMVSRSIVLDPVNSRIEQLRYDNHVQSLSRICKGGGSRTINFG